ncbi:MAG: hypothetical protein UBAL2_86920234 [Leptospirillum rubarum]|nr:MAG: hypothetical protein UBAL2_86920234 [Leptospirillum rubarum]
MSDVIIEKKTRAFGICLAADVVNQMDEECKYLGISRTQYILSLFENRNGYFQERQGGNSNPGNEDFRLEIESLRSDIRSRLAEFSLPSPVDLSVVTDAINDLSRRIVDLQSVPAQNLSSSGVDLSPLFQRLEDLEGLLRSTLSRSEPESDSSAMSLLALQIGTVREGMERIEDALNALRRSLSERSSGGQFGGELSELSERIGRLAESLNRNEAVIGEILRIGDHVREIRDRIGQSPRRLPRFTGKNGEIEPGPGASTSGSIPVGSYPPSEEPDPVLLKRRETRNMGMAVGFIILCVLAFMGWEIVGWYNGGDQDSSPPRPASLGNHSGSHSSPTSKNPR